MEGNINSTPEVLIQAIKDSNILLIRELLEANSTLAISIVPNQGISPLMMAIYYRNTEVIHTMRQFTKELSIFEASALGVLDVVKQYIEAGTKQINDFSPDGFTCLGLACFFGQLEMVKYLIKKGADVNIASSNAFKVAPLHSACAISNKDIILLLLENGANVNVKQLSGVTPLHSAAHHGQTELVALLIKYGADVNAKMESGQTPLMMAEEKGFTETINLLKTYH